MKNYRSANSYVSSGEEATISSLSMEKRLDA